MVVAPVRPRVRLAPVFSSVIGEEAVALAASAGLELDEWQSEILIASLAVDEDAQKWAAFEIGVDVSRQNGKGGILEARELAGLFLIPTDDLQIHTAHEADTSFEAFYRLEGLIQDTPELHRKVKTRSGYKHGHGQESINLKNGKRILFKTRTHGGRRGFSCDCLYLDEAMFIPEFTHGALLPTLSARVNPQVWYTGSAVDQEIHENGIVFSRVRERGHAGDDPRLAFFEWSLPFDSPGDVPDDVASDPEQWAVANPAMGIRISSDHIANEQRSMDPRTFAVERLGVGDWPRTDGVVGTMISFDAWQELRDESSELLDPVCLAFDVSPDRRTAIAAAGRRADGLLHVEILDHRQGTRWVPERLLELSEGHRPEVILCDAYGPAGSVVEAAEDVGVGVTTVSSSEHVQACGRLVDLVDEKGFRHLGSFELATAVRGAKPRPLGDAWAWSRKNSKIDISPLVAATLALSAAVGLTSRGGGMAVY